MRRSVAVLVAIFVAACGGGASPRLEGDPPPPVPTDSVESSIAATVVTSETTAPPTALPTTASTRVATTVLPPQPEIPPGPGVAIEAVGTVVEDRRGGVLCPRGSTGACPGLPLTGEVLPTVGDQVRVGGRYDGVSLEVIYTLPWSPREYGPYLNPCTGETNNNQASIDTQNAMGLVVSEHEDRYVGSWVADGQIVVALTGPDDEVAEELRQIEGVCVVTGYAHSASEVVAFTEGVLTPRLMKMGPPYAYAGALEVPETRILIEGDAVDLSTLDELTEDYGPIEVETFITVLDGSVSDLPVQMPLVPGDVTIPTGAMRLDVGMMALRVGAVLEYDAELNCLYIAEDQSRSVVIWPFGHTAVSGEVVQVFDPAGNVVAETGKAVDLGGGGTDLSGVDPAEACGADSAWQMAGSTGYAIRQVWGVDG